MERMRNSPSNRKYRFFLFFPLAFVAIFYLTFVTTISYSLNIPLTMTIIRTGVHTRTNNISFVARAYKTGKYRSSSYLVCLECQNIPVSYKKHIIMNYKFFTYIPLAKPLHINRIAHNIFHPPQIHTHTVQDGSITH